MKRQEQGVALLLSLVILLVLTLLAVSAMQGSVMQERMASAQRDGYLALEAAETAMSEVESILDALPDLDGFGTDDGFHSPGTAPDPFAASTWTSDDSIATSEVEGVTPRYFVEYKGTVVLDEEAQLPRDLGAGGGVDKAEMDYARIVVMANGPSGHSRRILEGFYVFEPDGLGQGE